MNYYQFGVINNSADDLVENQYQGKEQLRPLYEKIVAEVQNFGGDVKVTPKKTEVSLDRKHAIKLSLSII